MGSCKGRNLHFQEMVRMSYLKLFEYSGNGTHNGEAMELGKYFLNSIS